VAGQIDEAARHTPIQAIPMDTTTITAIRGVVGPTSQSKTASASRILDADLELKLLR